MSSVVSREVSVFDGPSWSGPQRVLIVHLEVDLVLHILEAVSVWEVFGLYVLESVLDKALEL